MVSIVFIFRILSIIRNFVLGAEDDGAENDRAENDRAEDDRAEDDGAEDKRAADDGLDRSQLINARFQ